MKRSNTKSVEKKQSASHSQKNVQTQEHKTHTGNYTQGDKIPGNIEDQFSEITLKRGKTPYNFYIQDMMTKTNSHAMIEVVETYSKKWAKMQEPERRKYNQLSADDKERYQRDLDIVKTYIIQMPLNPGATIKQIFLDEEIRKAINRNEDPVEAKKIAAEKWKGMDNDEKEAYVGKKADHDAFYEKLKVSKAPINAYALFMKDIVAKAKEKGEAFDIKEMAGLWAKSKTSVKDKYAEYAEELRDERERQRNIIELAFNYKPKKPMGAFKFFLMEHAKDGKLSDKGAAANRKIFENLSEKEKERYEKIATRAKLAYLYKKMEYAAYIKKNNPKRGLSPINFFYKEQKGKYLLIEDPEKGTFFEWCMKKWSKLDEAGKRKYIRMSEADKVLAAERKEEFNSRIFVAPKRPESVYNIYMREVYQETQNKNPKANPAEMFRLIGVQYKGITDKQKEKYQKIRDKEVEAYEAKLAEFTEKGFLVREDKDEKRAVTKTPKPSQKTAEKSRSASKNKKKKNAA